jgi:DNA-binding NarL/FixJ family response regulator
VTASTIRVAIADDHPIVRDGLRLLFDSRPEVDLVGEASDGADIIAVALQARPDVVIMDVNMPGTNGIDATRQIVTQRPEIGILVLTMYDDDETVFAALRAGAHGYLLKGAEQDEVVSAVIAVARGEAIFGAAVASKILAYFTQAPTVTARPFPELTERELEVLNLVASGRNNTTIAKDLGVSTKTVANHVSNTLTKLHLADRAEAIIRARDAGLGEPRT